MTLIPDNRDGSTTTSNTDQLAREVSDAYAAEDAATGPAEWAEAHARVWAAIRAKTLATNPDEWDDAS